MMSPVTLIGIYSVSIIAASLVGGWLPSRVRLDHVRMQIVLSFVGGLMLGIGLLHLLPHSYAQTASLDQSLAWTLVGLLGMFFLIRTFHFHQHGPALSAADTCQLEVGPGDEQHGEHTDLAGRHVHVHHSHSHTHLPVHRLNWAGVTFGLAVHTMMDGVALGAAVVAESHHGSAALPMGFGVFLAIVLHKPLDALSITTLMSAGGWSARSQWIVNAGFAAMCPLGALLVVLGAGPEPVAPRALVGVALGVSAGVFLCISLSDLLPEVQFHRHDRFKLSAALLAGVLLAYAIGLLEHKGAHDPLSPRSSVAPVGHHASAIRAASGLVK